MNLVKSQDYFNPLDVKGRCHIIGCGSIGSTVAELLVRLGITRISLYDFDTVSSHNLANQMFFHKDIGRAKVDALKDLLCAINPDVSADIKLISEGWKDGMRLNGYVFLCVDNIDLRREIASKNSGNRAIKAMFDFRTSLEEAQHYAANWNSPTMINEFIKSMEFSHEEAKEQTPVTACQVEMGVAPTVRAICDFGICNFMNFIRNDTLSKVTILNPYTIYVDKY